MNEKGAWLRKVALFAAVIGTLGAVSKQLKHLPASLFASRYFNLVRYGKIWCKIL